MSAIDPAVLQAALALTRGASRAKGNGGPDVAAAGARPWAAPHRPGRFLTVAQVAEELAVSESTVGTLIRRGRLEALKVHGRQWRVERAELEEFINHAYAAPQDDTGSGPGT